MAAVALLVNGHQVSRSLKASSGRRTHRFPPRPTVHGKDRSQGVGRPRTPASEGLGGCGTRGEVAAACPFGPRLSPGSSQWKRSLVLTA